MSKIAEAVNSFRNGYSCSQAILATYGPGQGLQQELALRVASGFGGGMGKGDTCGAVTGALMVLGLQLSGADCQAPGARAAAKAGVIQYMENFKSRRGSVMCRDLLGCDIGTGPGMECARKQGLFAKVCPKVVHDAAELLEEVLSRQ